ncbi:MULTISPECIES: BTAD domain-containing putative transcriptional regulator [unclassified Streptomyces]|uniref:AfsR/SARP family transcriptional regulator n=1 Tax=unclassified Streptomyces TaxID=2593676 RepID=UPI00070C2295|nr:BTAD domain-containing putative transcriptional regulator [Streptomyces sp. Root1310]KQX64293.1 AfsR family transcriptional regulator [Streptomyces sp. Root1310]
MPPEPLRFAVLGAVRVFRGDAELELGGPQERAFLALLLVGAGRPVAVGEIVDVLWGAAPPRSAVNVVRRHVGSLRRLLEPGLAARAEGRWLVRDAGGYRLVTDGDSSDLLRFRALREEGRRIADRSPGQALELLTEALSLWRGPLAGGVPVQARAHPAFDAVDRELPAAVRQAADVALRAGRPDAVLAELRQAAARHPLDEPLQAGLLLALAAAGHRPEALAAYEAVRARLAEELGIDPGAELRDARDTVLSGMRETAVGPSGGSSAEASGGAGTDGFPAPAPRSGEVPDRAGADDSVAPAPAPAPVPDPPSPSALPSPAQLPHDITAFTGRDVELDEVFALSGADGAGPGTVVISAIGGMAGVGKTTLAVHWAHRVADRFPDGQLYVNLRGFDPSGAVLDPGEAVRGFLGALGVPPERVPHGVDAQAALYRSVLAGRRVLVVLDNARDTEQVRLLLPGSPGCLAIVTSRDELTGLVAAHGAHSLVLRPFDAVQARSFLVRRLGAERVAAEPRAADEISALCAGLPLALACVAARAAAHPHFPLAAVAAELREAHGSLDAFARSDASVDVGTVFSWSSRAISAAAARLFRLLALHPGPDLSLPAAAALAGLPVRVTRPLLAELTGLHLVTEHSPGRYAFHDLLRAHAGELVHERHTEAERAAALNRLHHHYLHTAHAADRLLAPNADPLPPPPAPEGVHPEPLADDDRALAWLTAEHAVLLAVVETAAASGRPVQERLACQLAWSLEPFFDRRGHWHDGLAVQRTALDAARRLADPALEARGLRGLARVEGRLGLHSRSVPRLERALELFTELGDDTGRAHTHRSLGWECDQQGDLPGALRHNRFALGLFRTLGDRAAQASVLNSVGWYHARLGEHRRALTHCFEALAMLQELGDRYGQAATWDSIAYAHHHLGRHPHALLGYRNALALLRDLGVPYVEADILVRVGDTHLATGDHDGARIAWQRALVLLRGLNHPDAERVEALLNARDGHAGAV